MKITLLCQLGMSTSLLVEKMKTAAEHKKLDIVIEANSVDEIDNQLQESDVILLGPQIRYQKNELSKKAIAANVPIDVIDMKAYGTLNGEQVVNQALKLIQN